MSKKIKQELNKLEKRQEELYDQLKEFRANKKFKCVCGKFHAIKNCVAKRYWQRPYGSDDYGSYGEIYVVCPATQVENRFLFMSGYDLPYEERHSHGNNIGQQFSTMYWDLFKDRVLVETEHTTIPNNNEYVSENYKRFDLRIEYVEKMKQKFKNL